LEVGLALQFLLRLLEAHPGLRERALARGQLGAGQRRLALTLVSSSRARTCPSFTFMPSSTSTSVTLPVTLDETVASRRAVT
jgi:hypothetical protein